MQTVSRVILLLLVWSFVSCHLPSQQSEGLFSGENLSKWRVVDESKSFRINRDSLLCSGRPGLFMFSNGRRWKNFELQAEVKTSPGACTTVMFHVNPGSPDNLTTGYEVLVSNSCKELDNSRFLPRTGSLLGVRNVYFPMVGDDGWFTLVVRVKENHIESFINGSKVMDYIQPDNPWRGSGHEGRLTGIGTFAVKHYTGETSIRSLVVTALPDGEKTPLAVDEAWDTKVTQLMEKGFPLVDFHVHLKGGLTIQKAIANSQRLGINYGIAPNCGLRFPVTDNTSLAAYMDTVRGMPIFRGMQAEGREWITLFSPEAVAKFDYVFTDALTFTDAKGRRNRLWIPDEVWVEDKQQFMDQMVIKIEAILSQEPVDIYVNPTFLPEALMPEYDQLWTPARVERVIRVLAENNIALEINDRYQLPGAAILKAAKEAGLRFAFGTNNGPPEMGRLEYCLEMMEKYGLTSDDMFMPQEHVHKPVLVKGLPRKITG